MNAWVDGNSKPENPYSAPAWHSIPVGTQYITVWASGHCCGGHWAERQYPQGGGRWVLFKVATCHKWSPQGINIGLNAT